MIAVLLKIMNWSWSFLNHVPEVKCLLIAKILDVFLRNVTLWIGKIDADCFVVV